MRQPPFLPVLLALVSAGAAGGAEPAATLSAAGIDPLSIVRFEGREAISSLFHFEVDVAAGASVDFQALLGKEITLTLPLPGGGSRHVSGICSRFSQGSVQRLEIVPKLWLLTRSAGSRIFQDLSVPEILARLLGEAEIPYHSNLVGDFPPRNYAVQRNETDFAFLSRLMEEEGIFYFFTHSAGSHELVLANSPQGHPDVANGATARWLGSSPRPEQGVRAWTKTQELRSGKTTLRDHTFQFPEEPFEVSALIQDAVAVGRITHHLRPPLAEALEVYDFPGGYAGRFDGVDAPSREAITSEGLRTAALRVEQEAARALVIHGAGNLGQFSSGHEFALAGHPDADGRYVITSVTHSAHVRPSRRGGFDYQNTFTCIPEGLAFRPARITPRPHLAGFETAIVTGPPGAETHTDAFGRVKVQFHGDRTGSRDESSSCWIRVGALHAGQENGFTVAPRVGAEVLVFFLGGNPDRPIIVGSVYNPDRPPPPR